MSERDENALIGFVSGTTKVDPALARNFLDGAITDPRVSAVFPVVQISFHDDPIASSRLQRSLEHGAAPALSYSYIWRLGVADHIFAQMLEKVAELPDGLTVAIDSLHMQVFRQRQDGHVISEELKACGRRLLSSISFDRANQRLEHETASLAAECFAGDANEKSATLFMRAFSTALGDYRTAAYEYAELLEKLFSVQPLAALDVFFSEGSPDRVRIDIDLEGKRQLLDPVPLDTLLMWAKDDDHRMVRLAGATTAIEVHGDGRASWSMRAQELLKRSKSKLLIYEALGSQLVPSSFVGSLEDILQRNRPIVAEMVTDEDAAIAKWANSMVQRLDHLVAAERNRNRRRAVTFE